MSRQSTRTQMFAVAAVVTLVPWSVAEAQLSGGPGSPVNYGIQIERSHTGKSLYGYCDQTGSWDKLTVEPHLEDGFLSAIQTDGLAALRGKEHVYAFGAKSGKWASTKTDGAPSQMLVTAGVAVCVSGNHLYAFGPDQEKWAVVDIDEPADATKLEVVPSRVVYRTDTHVHAFSNASGKWASVDLTKD